MARIKGILLVVLVVAGMVGGTWFLVEPAIRGHERLSTSDLLELAAKTMDMQVRADRLVLLQTAVELGDSTALEDVLSLDAEQGETASSNAPPKVDADALKKLDAYVDGVHDQSDIDQTGIIDAAGKVFLAFPNREDVMKVIAGSNAVKSALSGKLSVGVASGRSGLFLVGAAPIWGENKVEYVAVQAVDLSLRANQYSKVLGSDMYSFLVQGDKVLGNGGSSEAQRIVAKELGKKLGSDLESVTKKQVTQEPVVSGPRWLQGNWAAVAGALPGNSPGQDVGFVVLARGQGQVSERFERYLFGTGGIVFGIGALLVLLLFGGVDKRLRSRREEEISGEPEGETSEPSEAELDMPRETGIPTGAIEQLMESDADREAHQEAGETEGPDHEEGASAIEGEGSEKEAGAGREPTEDHVAEGEGSEDQEAEELSQTREEEGEAEPGEEAPAGVGPEEADAIQEPQAVEPDKGLEEHEPGEEKEAALQDESMPVGEEEASVLEHGEVDKELEELAASVGDIQEDGWEEVKSEIPAGQDPDKLLEELEKEATGEQVQPGLDEEFEAAGELEKEEETVAEEPAGESAEGLEQGKEGPSEERAEQGQDGRSEPAPARKTPPPPPPQAMDAGMAYDEETDTTVEQDDPVTNHFRQVFARYKIVRTECGQPTDKLRFEKFAAKLKKNREELMKNLGCKDVRFSVYKKNGKAAIKATAVKE